MKLSPVLLSSLSLATLSANAQKDTRPNILIFIADDMGTNELSCYGGQNIQTPNIDRLASEGMRFTNNYGSMAMSVPIRASLYTGLYPCHHGSYQNHKATFRNTKSVTHYLSNLNYRVGRAGKDHPVKQPVVYNFEKIPGFVANCVASHPAVSTPEGIDEFIQRNDDQPFCLFVCSIHSHAPWDAGDPSEFNPNQLVLPPNCVDNAKTRSMFCNYLAEIRLLDNEVGMVRNSLEKAGKLDNTLFIFLGEQGPQMPFAKWTCYNYGEHSALIARYPKHIQAGSTSDALIQYEDILPTLMEVAGKKQDEIFDGKSALDIFYGKSDSIRQWAYGMHNNIPEGPTYPIRSIQDKRYKLIVNLLPDATYHEKHMMAPEKDNMWNSWLASATEDENAAFLTSRYLKRPSIEFYDHQNDPWELHNLADAPEHQNRIATMKTALEKWMEEQGDKGAKMDVSQENARNFMRVHPKKRIAINYDSSKVDSITIQEDTEATVKIFENNKNVTAENISDTDSLTFVLDSVPTYCNPVCLAQADPSCIRGKDNYFYLYSTGGKIDICRSKDMVHWEKTGTAFTDKTRPKFITYDDGSKPGLWAPDINYIQGKYVMYYSLHTDETPPKSGIGVAVANQPQGPFTDLGKLLKFDEEPAMIKGCIDPDFISDNGHNYLFFGSFSGIYAVELSPDGLSLINGSNTPKTQICGNGYEGTYIHKRGNYYYLFGSRGNTLPRETTQYRVVVGRSQNVLGPYTNKLGKSFLESPGGYVFLEKNAQFTGPGHNGEIFTDNNSNDWILYHAYYAEGEIASRNLMMDKIVWDDNDWPVMNDGNGPTSQSDAPEF